MFKRIISGKYITLDVSDDEPNGEKHSKDWVRKYDFKSNTTKISAWIGKILTIRKIRTQTLTIIQQINIKIGRCLGWRC